MFSSRFFSCQFSVLFWLEVTGLRSGCRICSSDLPLTDWDMTAQPISRRAFFTGSVRPAEVASLRPPWLSADRLSGCTACGACVSACPETVIKPDAAGRPIVDFSINGCTFCGECASACPENLFRPLDTPPWNAVVSVAASCFLQSGISCQLCTDFCDADALQYDLSVRPVGALRIVHDACTGCGMCVGACPAGAISVVADPALELSE